MRSKGLGQLKKDRRRGVSMAIVLCVSAFFIAFAAAIVYTSGLLTAQSTQRLTQERCRQLAQSYAEVLGQQLEKYNKKDDTQAMNTIYAFANQFLDRKQYLEYDPEQPDTTSYSYITSGTEDLSDLAKTKDLPSEYGNIMITFRKEANSGEDSTELSGYLDESDAGNYDAAIQAIKDMTIQQYVMTVEVTAYQDDISYTYSTEYIRAEKYNVEFTHNGKTIVWKDGNWYEGSDGGAVYTPDFNDGQIQYKYLTDSSLSCEFLENTYTDGETGEE